MELIRAKYLLPMEGEAIPDGAIVTEFDKILAVGQYDSLKEKYPQAEVTDHSDSVIMPGLINAHTHLDLTGAYDIGKEAVQTGSPDYIEWLVRTLEKRQKFTAQQLIVQIQSALKNIIDSGTTCIGDMTSFEGTFNLVDEMGLRAVIYPEIYAGAGQGGQDRFESALALMEKYLDANLATVSTGLGPFAPYLISRNMLVIIAQHAKGAGIPLQIHAAESFSEMEFFYDSKGAIATTLFPAIGWGEELPPPHHKTPIQYLGEIGFLDAAPTIVGGLHLGIRDFTILARNMCRVIYCPRMNSYLGHGNFPFNKLRDNGIPIAIGTDTLDGPIGFNMWEEMRFILNGPPNQTNIPNAREILQMATVGGARALALENVTGSLTPGKAADYIVLDLPECPSHALIYDVILRNTRPHNIKQVVVAGEILKNA